MFVNGMDKVSLVMSFKTFNMSWNIFWTTIPGTNGSKKGTFLIFGIPMKRYIERAMGRVSSVACS